MKEDAVEIFRQNGGILRMGDALKRGISRSRLYALRDSGELECLSRGLYRLRDLPEISDPDLVTVSARFPTGVLCLISALSFHHITTQIPHNLSLAVLRNTWCPEIDYPPVEYHQFSGKAYESGIEIHKIDGVKVKVYNAEKTLADCFKYRNKLGMDVVLEALKMYKAKEKINVDKVMEYAQVCRVAKVIRPYLEVSL